MSAMLKQKLIDIANGFTKYGLWKSGGSNLSELTDVTLTNLQTNDVLTYNGSEWVNDDNLQTQINTLNSNLLKCHINGNGNIEMLYFRWGGDLVAGKTVGLGSFESNIPSGKTLIGMFFTPLADVHVSMSYLGYGVYAYSESYSGNFVYDVLMIVS